MGKKTKIETSCFSPFKKKCNLDNLIGESEVTQSCPTLSDPMDYSLPGSSVRGIFQARVLEWVPFPSPGGLPDPGIEPLSPALAGKSHWKAQ